MNYLPCECTGKWGDTCIGKEVKQYENTYGSSVKFMGVSPSWAEKYSQQQTGGEFLTSRK